MPERAARANRTGTSGALRGAGGPTRDGAPVSLSRRGFLAASAAALVGLGRKSPRKIAGGFVDPSTALGHRLRDGGGAFDAPRRTVRVPVVIVGGGIAGLSAAWRLTRRGLGDFVLLEMEPDAGGNAAWGENEVTAYPWAAHYVPLPGSRAALVRELFEDLGVLRGGSWEERMLCFDPKERLYIHGEWQPELESALDFRPRDRDDFRRFRERVAELRATGELTIPMAPGSEAGAPRTAALDALSMGEWLRREGFTSEALRWYVDYACRDDYGALASSTSAWAGAHYFAARDGDDAGAGPLTWPEGNGWVVRRLLERLGDRVVTGAPAYRVERAGRRLRVLTPGVAYDAESVVFAAPTFTAPYVVEGMEALRGRLPFVYSPWLTANLTLERWPRELGRASVPPAWDNVLYDSPGLGYVVATHQSLRAQPAREERTVWTYYLPLARQAPAAARQTLLARGWGEWVEAILADLSRAHPDVRDCVSRVDVRRMGHAMVRPAPGFLHSPQRLRLAGPDAGGLPRLFFANSDLSGLSLFEEAQQRGVMAADRALAAVGGARG